MCNLENKEKKSLAQELGDEITHRVFALKQKKILYDWEVLQQGDWEGPCHYTPEPYPLIWLIYHSTKSPGPRPTPHPHLPKKPSQTLGFIYPCHPPVPLMIKHLPRPRTQGNFYTLH